MFIIPKNVSRVAEILSKNNYDAYLVGGCVRDLIIKREPNDWDITTNAKPEIIVKLFEEAGERVVYENSFGTVAIIFENEELSSNVRTIEVTPYRTETTYSDNRHPDEVSFSETLDEDLMRRDFTINALALGYGEVNVIDKYKGQEDLENKIIRTVGDPDERFTEDALRIMRAVRFAAQLGFEIERETADAIARHAKRLKNVSWERIREEFNKLIMSDNPMIGLELMERHNLLEHISPELKVGVGVSQNRSHIYGVWEHNIRACQNAADQKWPLHIRLSALFHDVGKPATKRFDKAQKVTTFYGHEVVGARLVSMFLKRLKYPKKLSEIVVKLVRYHMFFSDPEKITLSAARRMIVNVGKDHIWDLMNVRRSDRIGMGRPKAAPYRLRMYESMIEEALRDPIDVKMLKLNGDIMIAELGVKPGREIGWILHALLEEVLDDPSKNEIGHQKARALELVKLPKEELMKLGQAGKSKQAEAEQDEIKELRKKHKVRFEK